MPLPFTLPDFNVTANIWRSTTPTTDPPDVVTPAQLYVFSRTVIQVNLASPAAVVPSVELRVPMGTDLQTTDVVEVDAGTGFMYNVIFTERVHLGFANEYFMGLLSQGAAPPPPAGSGVLMEGGAASLAISAMTPGADVHQVDQLPMVIGGSNVVVTREDFLTGGSGEAIQLLGSPGENVQLDVDSTSCRIWLSDLGTVIIEGSFGVTVGNPGVAADFQIDVIGNMTFTCAVNQTILFTDGNSNCQILLDATAQVISISANNGLQLQSTSAVPGDWGGTPPLTVNEALDRIAAALGPIP